MKSLAIYSKRDFNAAVKYIASHNKYFIGKHDEIKNKLLDSIKCLVFSDLEYTTTIGCRISVVSRQEQGIDHDIDSCFVEFFVCPNLGDNYYDSDFIEVEMSE